MMAMTRARSATWHNPLSPGWRSSLLEGGKGQAAAEGEDKHSALYKQRMRRTLKFGQTNPLQNV